MDEQAMIRQAMSASNDMLDEYAATQQAVTQQSSQNPGQELPEVDESEESNQQLEDSSKEINKALDSEESKESDNWRKAREARRKLELENEELRRQLESRQAVQPQQPEMIEEEELEIDDFMSSTEDDAIVTAKEVKALINQNKTLAKTVKQLKQSHKIESAETRLRLQFPDYWNVVTPENLKLLAQEMPGTSEIVRTQKDPYLQHVAAYEAIKRLNAVTKKVEEHLPSKVKVANNLNKPKTMSTMSTSSQETPLSALSSHFAPLSDEEKARWRKIADDAIAGIN